jgi:hypothetical protein
LEDLNHKEYGWRNFCDFAGRVVGWAVAYAFICFFLLAPAAGIFWLVDQIPQVGRLEGLTEMFISVAVIAPLIGSVAYVLNEGHLKKKALIWEYHHDLVKLETVKQRDEIIGLRKKLGLPIEDY